ncbi:MAG TPA: DUF4410 domain-containing protein [Acidisoma sp.]|uniref:DUF4410 domain-containing protein n=1 Tax=Acidisoma sp. TaxID=1872115 RepID=UPI002CA5234C|nr:DUF4410 domain-containing protein [Acidisoma sp.]HTH99468.1 DUF4410 domain-containing protein [Acidisoma sp.]
MRVPVSARGLAFAALLLCLAGCAGAHVSDIASTRAVGPPPREILVDVETGPARNAAEAEDEQAAARQLRSDLMRCLVKAGLAAQPAAPGLSVPGAVRLHVALTRVDPGSRAKRLVIGFGAGRARLEARAELLPAGSAAAMPLTAFDTSSDTGMKPGLILPGGIALATGNAIHMAVGGGINLALNLQGGLAQTSAHTATAILDELRIYYRGAGWSWPGTA